MITKDYTFINKVSVGSWSILARHFLRKTGFPILLFSFPLLQIQEPVKTREQEDGKSLSA